MKCWIVALDLEHSMKFLNLPCRHIVKLKENIWANFHRVGAHVQWLVRWDESVTIRGGRAGIAKWFGMSDESEWQQKRYSRAISVIVPACAFHS